MKAKADQKQERWVRMFHRVLQSPAFTELSYSASRLYIDLRLLLNGTNNGNISATLSTLRYRGWRSPTTLAKNLRQLEAVGLIAKTRRTVGVENGSKLCNLYRFTDEPCYEVPRLGISMMKGDRRIRSVQVEGRSEGCSRRRNSAEKKGRYTNC